MNLLILLLGIACNASASILIKIAVSPPRVLPAWNEPWLLLGNIPLLFGILMYGGAFLLYALALARMPLNIAHPVLTSGAIATVALASALLFRESFPWTTVLGIALVVAGVVLITWKVQ